jgi:cyclic beta-1,2-glucan synthetase
MMERGIVLGFYPDKEIAGAVLRDLQRRKYRNSAVIHRNEDDKLDVEMAGGVFTGRHRSLIARYQRCVVRKESLIIVSAPARDMGSVLDILRENAAAPPITFAFHPVHQFATEAEEALRYRPLLSPQGRPKKRLAAVVRPAGPRIGRTDPLMGRVLNSESALKYVQTMLADTARAGQPVSMAADWLLDNVYLLQGHIDDFRRNLPRHYASELPILVEGPQAGLPRTYGLVTELIGTTDTLLDQQRILDFFQAYQVETPLTMGELWSLPLMLRLRMIECIRRLAIQVERREREREQADFWANRILTAARQETDCLKPFVEDLAREQPAPTTHFLDQLVGYLYDEEVALAAIREWLEKSAHGPMGPAIQQEHIDQTAEQVALANAITSLRRFSQMDWRDIFEALSLVEARLRTDPAGIYAQMDFASRDHYRHAIEETARNARADENQVTGKVLELADAGTTPLTRHIGYYLLDEGRAELERQCRAVPKVRVRALRWARAHATGLYTGSIAWVTLLALSLLLFGMEHAGTPFGTMLLLGLLALLPASEIAVQSVNYVITRLMPPQFLPKMSYEAGIPDESRALVIVPMMLLTPQSIREQVELLEIRYLANPITNLCFGLLSDYSDAPQREMPDDVELLDVAVRGIEQLNARYGEGRFFLFHRERQWSASEQRWIGWERKRGKLEHLNRFLMGETGPDLDNLLHVGEADALRGIGFVITLDADTQLPRETARRMVETLAHPLNRAHVSADGRRVERGYTIIQPMVSTSLPSATATLFSRIFTDAAGIDPYTHAISDVYQDLAGEGSYHGKGIYDLHAFHTVLSGRFPEAHLLSHDLIEGAHVRVGLASDIELLDFFPKDYLVYSGRQHRWTRGDWQIVDWLLPQVPTGTGERSANPLSLLSRWKIADNLRRSLLPAALVALLLTAWFLSPVAASAVSLFVAFVMFLPPLTTVFTHLTGRASLNGKVWLDFATTLARCAIFTALLPHQAMTSLDAIGRVWYRRLVSHKLLLEWETAHEAHRNSKNRQRQFLTHMLWMTAVFIGLSVALALRSPAAEHAAELYLGLWIVAPLLIGRLNSPLWDRSSLALTSDDRRLLRQVARQTWRFFQEFVCVESNWLPPDNYQEFIRHEVAQRTSPTNIGLSLLAPLIAHDFGYVVLDEVVDRTLATMQTLDKLERYQGHLLNWYDIQNLQPLLPRYVSMVDSGNLLGNLWAMEQGMEEVLSGPVITRKAFRGLEDTLALLRNMPAMKTFRGKPQEKSLIALEALAASTPQNLEHLVANIRLATPLTRLMSRAVGEHCAEDQACRYWAQQAEKQVKAWNEVVDRYLHWVELLAAPPEGGLLRFGPDAHEGRRLALSTIPSLQTLAAGNVTGLRVFVGLQARVEELKLTEPACAWLQALADAAARAQWLAGERLSQANDAIVRVRALADGMNMKFLYDTDRDLFFTGYNVADQRMDAGHYDLMASEARLGSFVAVARGEVPLEHWWALGRPYGSAFGERALLSWSGTMFEYLMPLLMTRSFDNSMLDRACKTAVDCQIAYGKQRNIPWGISEAAYSALDAHQIYQYQAFGVPGLGMKRGLEDDLVVAPYASALALAVEPVAAVRNLRRLDKMGMRRDYGFYESIDYSRQEGPAGERGVIVYSYMSHHQGMILSAIDNVLNDDILQERFHRSPSVRATESLLYERIPPSPALIKSTIRREHLPRLAPLMQASAVGRIETPHTNVPRTNLLSNGTYSVMVTNSGGGYSQWKDREITRWRSDTTRDAYGSFCYIKDCDTGIVWSTAYQPVRTVPQRYSVTFAADKAEYKRRDNGIETITEIVVSPEDSVEVRRITLSNRSLRKRSLELTSYLEVAMAGHNADRAHPAFSKLFVATEALPDHHALLAGRRPRAAEDAPIWALHCVADDGAFDPMVQYETDRARFLGRGRGADRPIALEGELSQTVGDVLDPVFSLRRRVTLEPGARVQIAFVTGAAGSRDEAVALSEKYHDLRSAHRAIEMAWTHAQLELRHLRIHQDEAQMFQQLAAHVLYPNALLRPGAERLTRRTLGQSRLWAYGISGDLPIIVLSIGDPQDIDLVRQTLMAHTYWQQHGLKTDLVILNEEGSTYDQPLQNQLRRTVEAYSQLTGTDRAGGVFLRPAEQIPAEDRALLMTTARVTLIAARGSLAQQLGTPIQSITLPSAFTRTTPFNEEPSTPLPFMELSYFNSLGGFTADGREYVIYLGPGDQTPMPWINVMANPSFGTLVSESGQGYSWYGNSQSNRLTPWTNDPVSDPSGDTLYIRDEELGVVWTPTPLPIREEDAYRIHHGQGYTHFEHNSHSIDQWLTTTVPVDDQGGAPVRLQRLRLTNCSSRKRRLTVTLYGEWTLGTEREETASHIFTQWDAQHQILTAGNPYHPDFGDRIAFVASNLPIVSFTGDRAEFIGRNGVSSAPAALTRSRLAGRTGAGLDPCYAIQVSVEIQPGQESVVVFLLGQAADAAEAVRLTEQFRSPEVFEATLTATCDWWNRLLDTVQVATPDPAVNFLLNRWLLYQDVSCRLWGRSAFYQSGGAYGFRDQLQDVMALVYAAPQLARDQIVRTAARQFVEGDVQHWWHPPAGAGVRTRISDDLLFLPFTTAHYVRVTGDTTILDEVIPFLGGKPLEKDEHESFYLPPVSEEKASLLEHCRRAIAKGATVGPHGLPLIGTGDWNDGLNRVGVEGKGESVWLAWFLIHALHDFAELLRLRSQEAEAVECEQHAVQLAGVVEAQAWDGEWYRRAYFDDGTPLGSQENDEAQIDSLGQSWAVISGMGDPQRAEMAMQAVQKRLVRSDDRLMLLFTPPFDKTTHDPGYIKGYPPGVRENGGQYTHGSLWVPLALARQGKGDEAVAILRMMNPVEHAREPEDVQRYKVEPYVVAADIYALKDRVGQGGWTWYTGSASWMYRVWLEEIVGFHLRGNQLSVNPTLPMAWNGFTVRYRYHNTPYEIIVENPDHVGHGVVSLELDGQPVAEQSICLEDDNTPHTLRIRMGPLAPPPAVPALSG